MTRDRADFVTVGVGLALLALAVFLCVGDLARAVEYLIQSGLP